MALKESSKEAIYLNNLIQTSRSFLELNIPNKVPIIIKLAKNPEFHRKTKYINIIYYYIREKIANKKIEIFYIPTREQIADSLIKPISLKIFKLFKE